MQQQLLNSAGMNTTSLKQSIESSVKELAGLTDQAKISEWFKSYIETAAKFNRYSLCNQLLIMFQMPTASRVCGFVSWNKLGRHVKKGCRGIRILAPSIKTIERENAKGNTEEKVITNFFPVSVFDISQTEGKDLPDVDLETKYNGDKELMQKLTDFCSKINVKIELKQLSEELFGYSQGGLIVLNETKTFPTMLSTFVHEIAHELLHHKDSRLSRGEREIQAEGTAFVVCKHFGAEPKSFNYLAIYNADYKKIMQNLEAISETSKRIIESIEV